MKTLIKIILLLGIVGYLVYVICKSPAPSNTSACRGLELDIVPCDDGKVVVDSAIVAQMLADDSLAVVGVKMEDIDLLTIDSLLKAHPYVTDAMCYKTSDDLLHIKLNVTGPVMRIIPTGGKQYYINENGDSLPAIKEFDLPVATGCITRNWAAQNLPYLYAHMKNDPFVADIIEQISVARDSTVTIVPTVGDFVINLGRIERLDSKFADLNQFYSEVLPKMGWNKYSQLNLEFENQIVCTKKKVIRK